MKQILILILVCFSNLCLIAQKLSSAFEFNANITTDLVRNFSGGMEQGNAFIGVEQATLNFNTDSAKLWGGGNVFLHLLNTHGDGPTKKYVGDMMYFSNIEAGNHFGLYEVYYAQEINRFSFLIGQHDLNTEFAGTKYGENFINSSYGVISNVLLNVPLSIYPIAAPCIVAKYQITDHLKFKIATYDGVPGTIETNHFNLEWNINRDEGFFNIAEISYKVMKHNQNGIHAYNGLKMGNYKLGMYYHTGKFVNNTDSTQLKRGNYGFYFIADHMILPKPSKPEEGLAFILELGWSPPKINLISRSVEVGLRYHGILPFRTRDFIGIAYTSAMLSSDYLKNNPERLGSESSLEVTYKFQFGEHFFIQPDFQYIIHPGALRGVENAFAGTLRMQVGL